MRTSQHHYESLGYNNLYEKTNLIQLHKKKLDKIKKGKSQYAIKDPLQIMSNTSPSPIRKKKTHSYMGI